MDLPFEEKYKWERRTQELATALKKVDQIGNIVGWAVNDAVRKLKADLENVSEFYNFLLTTKIPVLGSIDMGYFSVLPNEVTSQIVSYLDLKSTCRMTQVCRQFHVIAEDEMNWNKLAIEYLTPTQVQNKPTQRTWKWLCHVHMKIFKPDEFKDQPGTFTWPCSAPEDGQPRNHVTDSKYSGDWGGNIRNGFGTYYWCNGSFYSGEWKDDKRHGHGTRVWPNKNKYIGEYQNHKRHGTGEFTFSNGSVFYGQFGDNKFMRGTYTWPNARVYDGEWDNIYRHGKGSYWWPDGRTYVGNWTNDKRHGKGIYSWPDGDCYEGEFHDGKRWGPGVLKCANGDVYEQEWREDKFEEFKKGIENGNSTVVKILKKRKLRPDEVVVIPPPKFSRNAHQTASQQTGSNPSTPTSPNASYEEM